ncbi:Hypothetical protein R9X50_00501700 [Acrodontium crateriforme]|uniref:HNH nuclease domain-containing protein n=1 Tax=Acrodontium crateriforme TaxID=150365 RepID=A0AAQ3MC25_9PEZI|nr:Hypothetical protein R9X50_00501700 [Acrodontium crateriforme]
MAELVLSHTMSNRVRVRHPGYPRQNILFSIPARDGPNHDRAHFETVKAICSIITDNEVDVWLTSVGESTRVESDADGLIPGADYYLQVPQGNRPLNTPYPIVPTFRSWAFPHDAIPALWHEASKREEEESRMPDYVLSLVAEESCRITTFRLAREDAHIIPASEKLWFTSNEMDEYGRLSGRSGDTVADTWFNKMRLQAQAHKIWDDLDFAIIPKSHAVGQVGWFTQMMSENDELEKHWHNKPLLPLTGRSLPYLYGRFAYTIFPKLHAFLQGGQARELTVHLPDGTKITKNYGAAECYEFSRNQGRGRSASSRKRSKTGAENAEDTEYKNDDDFAHASDRTHSQPTSVDSAISGVAQRDESGSIDAEKFGSRHLCVRQEGEWWQYLCGHEFNEQRGRKRLRNDM